jgi:hypothetical protein
MEKMETPMWKQVLKDVKNKYGKLPQRRDSTVDQLKDLIVIAERFGFYDAADYLKQNYFVINDVKQKLTTKQ